MTTLVELCCGTASVSLAALAGEPVEPLTGFMGSKRRWSGLICSRLGFSTFDRPDHVVLVDAGPWGDVWSVLRERGARLDVSALLRSWSGEDASALWKRLVSVAPFEDGPTRVAQYLWLQARSAGTIPVWWSPERSRWESPTGSRTEAAHSRGGAGLAGRETGSGVDAREELRRAEGNRKLGLAHQKNGFPKGHPMHRVGRPAQKGLGAPVEGARNLVGGPRALGPAYEAGGLHRKRVHRELALAVQDDAGEAVQAPSVSGGSLKAGCRGIQYPGTIARRIDALDAIPWERVEVIHDRVENVEPIPGARVYFDPPYDNAPRYAVLFPRSAVVATAERWAAVADRIVVSEGEGLPITGARTELVAHPKGKREAFTIVGGRP